MLKNLHFFILITFALSSVSLAGKNDLVVTYDVPPRKQITLFNTIVRDTIPDAPKNNYHVTLGWIENVVPKDRRSLQACLKTYADQLCKGTTFTAHLVKRYLVNRGYDTCPLVLTPQESEIEKLRGINLILLEELNAYNKKNKTAYTFHRDVLPGVYDPHITLVNKHDIARLKLDRDFSIRKINLKLQGFDLELIH